MSADLGAATGPEHAPFRARIPEVVLAQKKDIIFVYATGSSA